MVLNVKNVLFETFGPNIFPYVFFQSKISGPIENSYKESQVLIIISDYDGKVKSYSTKNLHAT